MFRKSVQSLSDEFTKKLDSIIRREEAKEAVISNKIEVLKNQHDKTLNEIDRAARARAKLSALFI